MNVRQGSAKSRVLRTTIATTIAMCAAAPGAVNAQDETTIAEVIVTAQKREQKLSEVPVSLQALRGVELESIGVRDLSQMINSIPGASLGRSLSASARSYQIRGIAGYYGDATVGYYIDDAVFTILNRNFGPSVNAFDVERVEVLRGPQGTLYGSGAMGGTIRFVTADPNLEEFQVRGNTGYTITDDEGQDADDNYYANLAVSIPIVEGRFGVRASVSRDYQGGFATSAPIARPSPPADLDGPGPLPPLPPPLLPTFPSPQPATFPNLYNEVEVTTYRLKALFQPTDAVTAKLSYQHNETSDPLGRQMASIDPNAMYPSALNGVPVEPKADTEYDMFGLFLSFDFGSVILESSSGYLDRTASASTPIFTPFFAQEVPVAATSADSDTLTSELRLLSAGDGQLNWIIGAQYQDAMAREDIDARFYGLRWPPICTNPTVPPGPPFPPRTGLCEFRNDETTYESTSYAAFGEISYALFDGRLIPLIGLRYFKDDRSFQNRIPQDGPVVFDTDTVAGDPGDFDSTNGRFNLSYVPRDGVMFYLNVASGFRSGTFNSTDGVIAARDQVPSVTVGYAVEPDQLWSYEVGAKLNFERVALELAAYYIDWTDVQLNFSGARNVQYIANAGDVIGEGLDYGLNWQLTDGLLLQLTGNINSTELDKLAPGFPGSASLVVGEQLRPVPEQTHRLALNYERPLGGSGLSLTLFGSYAYADKQGDVSDTVLGRFGESQELLSARIGIQAENWGVRLVGDNLLKEKDPIQVAGSGVMRAYPMTYGLELNFDF